MKNRKCSKRYPKEYYEQTIQMSDGYSKCQYMDNGAFVLKDIYCYTNWDVIPCLSVKYNCHINEEIVNSIIAVMYLCKGHDQTCVSLQIEDGPAIDEIREYLDSYYISAYEACWRIFDFPLHQPYPAIQCLQLHFQNQQYITFNL